MHQGDSPTSQFIQFFFKPVHTSNLCNTATSTTTLLNLQHSKLDSMTLVLMLQETNNCSSFTLFAPFIIHINLSTAFSYKSSYSTWNPSILHLPHMSLCTTSPTIPAASPVSYGTELEKQTQRQVSWLKITTFQSLRWPCNVFSFIPSQIISHLP